MEEKEIRLEKYRQLLDLGINIYPARSHRTHTAKEALENFEQLQEKDITLVGRIVLMRIMGGASFAQIEDGTGRIQVYIRKDDVGEESYQLLKKFFDLGDFIQATGRLFLTKTGEKTLHVYSFKMISKTVAPMPDKYHGLEDVETRYRKRYLDLIANREEVLPAFLTRSKVISSMRRFLEGNGFIEVETPILQPQYGGATARPFTTHHNALDQDMYLRIATELYLKRLIVGGIERVFEIGKQFRNEGIDRNHNPEFTSMECYQAYADYNTIMNLTEQMIFSIVKDVLGSPVIKYQGIEIDTTPPWPRTTMRDFLIKYADIDIQAYNQKETLLAAMHERHIDVDSHLGWGRLVDELKSHTLKNGPQELKQPLFVTDYPLDVSPLAKKREDNPEIVERFQAFLGGLEVGNAFSELNDSLDQRARFEDQARQREAGDEEAQVIDEDFIQSLEAGMPPTGGLGIGVDRLVMVISNQSAIRDVILFPTMRIEGKSSHKDNKDSNQKPMPGKAGNTEDDPQDFTRKIVVVLNKDVEQWKAINGVSHVAAYIGNKMQERFDTGGFFITKDSKKHPKNSQYAIIVLSASSGQMKNLITKVRESGLLYHAFISDMFENDDIEVNKSTSNKLDEEIEYIGIGIFGKNEEVDALTKKFSLWK